MATATGHKSPVLVARMLHGMPDRRQADSSREVVSGLVASSAGRLVVRRRFSRGGAWWPCRADQGEQEELRDVQHDEHHEHHEHQPPIEDPSIRVRDCREHDDPSVEGEESEETGRVVARCCSLSVRGRIQSGAEKVPDQPGDVDRRRDVEEVRVELLVRSWCAGCGQVMPTTRAMAIGPATPKAVLAATRLGRSLGASSASSTWQ